MSFQFKEIVTLILLLNWAQDSQPRDGLLGVEKWDPSPLANIAAKSFLSKVSRVQLIPFCLLSFIHFSCSSSPGCNLPRKGSAWGKPIPLAAFLAHKILGTDFPEGVLIWQLRLTVPPSYSWFTVLPPHCLQEASCHLPHVVSKTSLQQGALINASCFGSNVASHYQKSVLGPA